MASIKAKVLRKLVIYFMELGYIPSYREYVKLKDKPVKASFVRAKIGSWGRVEKMIARNFPDEYAEILAFAQKEAEPEPVVAPTPPRRVVVKPPVAKSKEPEEEDEQNE